MRSERPASRWLKWLLAPLLVVVLVAVTPILVVFFAGWLVQLALLHLAVLCFWLPRGRRVLFVYSDSPNWKPYIEQNIMPRLPQSVVLLNWSQRSTWRRLDLPVLLFKFFAGRQDFNPIAIVFRPFRKTKTFRFWHAFRDYKHGKAAALQKVEDELFRELAALN